MNNDIFATDFSKELKRIRLKCSCSQAEFCRRLSLSNGTYSAWETGRFLPSVRSLTKVCEGLNAMNLSSEEIETLKNKYYDLKVKEK